MKKFLFFVLLISGFLFFTPNVFAADFTTLGGSGCLTGGSNQVATISCLPIILGNVIYWIFIFAGIVAVAMIIISGFKFVSSGGDAKKAEGAKKTLTFSILGLALILLSFIILPLIIKLTGTNTCINKFGFSQCVPEAISNPCSNTHPEGFCETGKSCVLNDTGSHYVCRFACSKSHTGGYCPSGKSCTKEDGIWACRIR